MTINNYILTFFNDLFLIIHLRNQQTTIIRVKITAIFHELIKATSSWKYIWTHLKSVPKFLSNAFKPKVITTKPKTDATDSSIF